MILTDINKHRYFKTPIMGRWDIKYEEEVNIRRVICKLFLICLQLPEWFLKVYFV